MEIIIYFLIFVIGTLFGSFFSLAVYRIPIKQSIMYGRSYCPNCNHKLQLLDLIPVLSYIFLGGKCRYCKEKIRGRYLFLEILSGIVFLLFAISLKINIYSLEIHKLIYFLFGTLFIVTLVIIAGIEKENHTVSNSVLLFGIISEFIYIVYLYVLNFSIYRYVIYLSLLLLFVLINTIALRNKGKEIYTIQILTLCVYIANFLKEEFVIISIFTTLFLVLVNQIIIKIKDDKKSILKTENNDISIGFYLCCTSIAMFILQTYIFM